MEPISLVLCLCGAAIVLPILAILSRLSRFLGGSSQGTGSARPRARGIGGGGTSGGSARPRHDDPDVVSSGGFGGRAPAPRQPEPRRGRPDSGSSSRDSGGGIGGLFGDLMPRDKRDDDEAAGEIVLGGDDDDPKPRTTRPTPRDERRGPSRGGKVDDDDIESRGGFGRSK